MKQRIDHLADLTVSQLSKLRKECLESFTKFKAESDLSLKKLEELMKSNRQVTKSDNNFLIIDTAKDLTGMKLDLPKFGNLPDIKLTLGFRSDADKLLQQAFGYITYMTRTPDQQHNAHDQLFKSIKKEITGRHPLTTVRQLLNDPVMMETLQLSFNTRSMAVTHDGNVWFHEYGSTSLHYIDQTSTLHELKIKERILDISVNSHTDVLYCLLNNHSIVTVDRWKSHQTVCR